MSPVSSNSSVSRRAALTWTLLLIVPNIVLVVWLFDGVSPRKVLSEIYAVQEGVPSVSRLPIAFAVAGLACALFRKKRPAIFNSLSKFVCSAHGVALIAAAIVVIVAAILGSGFFLSVLRAAWGGGVLFCASGIGLRILTSRFFGLQMKSFDSPLECLVLSTALGLGTLSLMVFGFATVGVMSTGFWRVAILGLAVSHFSLTRTLATDVFQAWKKWTEDAPPFALIAAVFVGLILATHAPLIWNIPVEYDVLEYHLGAPAQYLRAGSASFLNENIYATFSQNAEMLYLLPMMLAGDKIAGLPGAHVLVFAAWCLSVLGVYVLTRRLERSLAGSYERALSVGPIAGALLFAVAPLGSQLAADFYAEHFQTLFHICAVLCASAFISDFKIQQLFKGHALHNPPGWLIGSGIFAGLCCGTKYTGLLFTLAPLAVFLPVYCAFTGAVFEALIILGQFLLPALLVFAPWMIRNGVASGDPIHPLGLVMRRRLAGPSGVPDRIDHFEAAVRTGEVSWQAFWNSLKQLMPGFRENFPQDVECGPQLCFFAVPGLSMVTNAETTFVAFVFIADLLAWYFFSHRLNRFFYPHLTALAAIGGMGVGRIWRVAPLRKVVVLLCVIAVVFFVPIQMQWVAECSSREGVAGNASLVEIAKAQIPDIPVLALAGTLPQAGLPEKSKVLFIGEAQTFYCARTPSYSVVFNQSLLEEAMHRSKNAAETIAFLRERGITHLYFNYLEWLRLDTSYALRLEEGGARWETVHWSGVEKLELHYKAMKLLLIRDKKFAEYGAEWPASIYPAYLKLTPEEYERLDEIYRNHSHRIWPEADSPLELRALE